MLLWVLLTKKLIRVYSKMTKAVRKVARKKKVFLLFGYRRAAKLHALRMMYSIASALKPMAAFRSVLGSPFSVFIKTL